MIVTTAGELIKALEARDAKTHEELVETINDMADIQKTASAVNWTEEELNKYIVNALKNGKKIKWIGKDSEL